MKGVAYKPKAVSHRLNWSGGEQAARPAYLPKPKRRCVMLNFKREIYIGGKDTPIIVQTMTYKGREALDIRATYSDKATGELKPAKAGVRFYFDDEAVLDGETFGAAEALLVALAEFEQAYDGYKEDSGG